MSRKFTYVTALIIFIAIVGLIVYKYKTKVQEEQFTVYTLLPRKGVSAKSNEWKNTRLKAAELTRSIEANKDDVKSMLSMAAIFVKEARVTGDYIYYDKAAMQYVDRVLQKDSLNFEALVFKSLLYLSQHHFNEGLIIAEKARNINPYNSYVYGMLVDGNVEMGKYDSAIACAQKMIDIRPDLRSYSRISYIREIFGDYTGAIEAMKMAVEAGVPGDESTEWARVQLGHLFENAGDLKSAETHYRIALQNRPEYPYALAGLARIALSKKDYNQAISYYQMADSSIEDFSIKEGLSEAYALAGQREKAQSLEKKIVAQMNGQAQQGQNDENIGHYVDKELAYSYLNLNDFDKALEHALLEYNRRPDNIDVNEAVAWVYYCKGDYQKALPFIKAALKTHSKNPVLLCRAGLIYAKAGDKIAAKTTLEEGLKQSANITENLKTESIRVLEML